VLSDSGPRSLTVATDAGSLRGIALEGVAHWRGIPYAAPPVGDLRFRAPRPPEPWDGERDATRFAPIPPQEVLDPRLGAGPDTPMSEDCLTLTVSAPAGDRQNLPVVVWIHGGAYVFGAGTASAYEPSSLVRDGQVVVVSVNYRLGALGWLDLTRFATPERPLETNLALRDQIAALQWVQRNISGFGGDPTSVTILGESAGATSVLCLLAAPAAAGLFARAIAQSPTPGSVWTPAQMEDWATSFVGRLDGHTDPLTRLLTAAPDEFVRAARSMMDDTAGGNGRLPFGPVVDGDVLPVPPLDAASAEALSPVPLLVGTNDLEGTLFQKLKQLDILPTDEERIELFLARVPDARENLLATYPGYPKREPCARIGGDGVFWAPTLRFADAHSAVAPTWVYRFDFAPRAQRLAGYGATHGSELSLLFGTLDDPEVRRLYLLGGRSAARALSERLRSAWLSFVRGAVVPWPRYEQAARATQVFDAEDRVERDPRADRRRAWEPYLA
jgi:para-nitrobenzyl esterase